MKQETKHLLDAIEDTAMDEEWYAYDYTAGTFDTPKNIVTVDDVETFIGFREPAGKKST